MVINTHHHHHHYTTPTTTTTTGLVWSDLKLNNFVCVGEDGGVSGCEVGDSGFLIKGLQDGEWRIKCIDLESCVDQNKPLQDFSPEILAPEQVIAVSSSSNVLTTDQKVNGSGGGVGSLLGGFIGSGGGGNGGDGGSDSNGGKGGSGLRLESVTGLPVASTTLDTWAFGIALLHLHLGK